MGKTQSERFMAKMATKASQRNAFKQQKRQMEVFVELSNLRMHVQYLLEAPMTLILDHKEWTKWCDKARQLVGEGE